MSLRLSLLALGALGLAAALSGCVAAVIPLAAGALMASSAELDGGDDPAPAVPAEPPPPAAFAEALALEPTSAITIDALPSPSPPPPVDSVSNQSPSPQLSEATDTGGLHAQASGTMSVMAGPLPAPSSRRDSVVESFFAHALDQAQRNPVLTPRQSALLAEPGLLRPERMDCGLRPPAVILDLDPGRESFDPLTPVVGNPPLAAALSALRERDVTVFWTSHLGEGFADALRGMLAETGLDPTGQDRLLLLRSLDQRKHTLRTEIASSYCVVAMLGDERADFDELFYYLRQPDTALQLDAMLGSGWFLADPISSPAIDDETQAGGEPQP